MYNVLPTCNVHGYATSNVLTSVQFHIQLSDDTIVFLHIVFASVNFDPQCNSCIANGILTFSQESK